MDARGVGMKSKTAARVLKSHVVWYQCLIQTASSMG